MAELHAPHRHIPTQNDRERFLVQLFDALWERYRDRMEYVRKYEEILQKHGAGFTNDHIAFRTLAVQKPPTGIFMISRMMEALGYRAAGCYEFPDKSLSSVHYEHFNPQLPRLFITQLKTWELSSRARRLINKSLKTHRPPLLDAVLSRLRNITQISTGERLRLQKILIRYFHRLPWDLPQKKDVLALNEESQFGAWVLVNGYDVNHFTASVDSHGVSSLDDIDKTALAMTQAGIPMKKEIEGERGSKLRQTSTESVLVQVAVKEGPRTVKIPWSYAYFEIAERPLLKNPLTGQMERFGGFLGGQATNLFEMTKTTR